MSTLIIPTRNPLWSAPYTDSDAITYGEAPQARIWEMRVANAIPGTGALVTQRTDPTPTATTWRTGQQLRSMVDGTGGTASVGALSSVAASGPTGYGSNVLRWLPGALAAGAGGNIAWALTTLEGQRMLEYGGGTVLRLWVQGVTTITGLRFRLQFTDTVTGWVIQYTLVDPPANTSWFEARAVRGYPVSTTGTPWSTAPNRVAVVLTNTDASSQTYDIRLLDLRVGLVQTAKTVPDGDIAWESSYDARARYRDDATAKLTTTMAATSAANATNIKLASVTGTPVLVVGDMLTLISAGGGGESRAITAIGTAGSGGSGVTVSEGYTNGHTSGDSAAVYNWGPWSAILAATKFSQPPTYTASSPADKAVVTDPTLDLVKTYSSPAGKAKSSGIDRIYRRFGYAQNALTRGAVAYYRLGETAGTAAVDLVAAHNGVYTGGYTLNQAGALTPSDSDAAVLFNGSTGYVTIPTNTALHPGDTFTVAAWIKKAVDGTDMTIWSGGVNDIIFRMNAANLLALQKQGGSSSIQSLATITGTDWHHVAIVKAGAVQVLYIDGVPDPSANISNQTIVASTTDPRIGLATSGVFPWNGTIDEVLLFNRALAADSIASLAAARLEVPNDQLIYTVTTPGAGLTTTLDDFLLAQYGNGATFAWEADALDTDGLVGTTARRSFSAVFVQPAVITNLTATQDAPNGAIVLAWDASVDVNFDHYRADRQQANGDLRRIDGGPAALGDGLPRLTAPTWTDYGGRQGWNTYLVTQHTGALESDPAIVTVWLDPVDYRSGFASIVRGGDPDHTFGIALDGAPDVTDLITDTMTPPGLGYKIHHTWGFAGRHVQVQLTYLPAEDGDRHELFRDLARDGLSFWFKTDAAYLGDPMRAIVSGNPQKTLLADGFASLTIDLDETSDGA